MDKQTGNSDEQVEDDDIMEVTDLGIRKRGIKTVDLTADSDGDGPSKDSMVGTAKNEPSDDSMGVTKATEESADERVVKNVQPEANLMYVMRHNCKRMIMVFHEMCRNINTQELWSRSRPLLLRMVDISVCFVLILLQSLQFLAMGLHMALCSLEFALGLLKVLLGGLIATVGVVRLASRPRTRSS